VGATLAPDGAAASPWDVVLRRLRAATLGEFEIKRELGRGGMAAVYLAHEVALDRKVALKVMSPGIMMAEGMVERFRLEAVTVANLSHPNIVRVHGVRQLADDLHFIVMQYIGGRTLDRVLREVGSLPAPIVRTILGQVGRALAHAHKRGVVHRDIKPGNVMLDATGDAVVTDFGIAKVATASSHTLTGSVVGTPSYMSPEQCYAQPLTGASDQYSLGVVAFEMLTGSVPFTGAPYTVMHGHTHGEIPPVRDLRPDCPSDLADIVARMLAKAPGARFASMPDAVDAIGAPPLGEHDPLRDELARLAAPEEAAMLDAMYPTPMSPVPRTRASSVARPASPTPASGARAPELLSVAWRPAATPHAPTAAVTPPVPSSQWTPRRVVAWSIPLALAAGGAAILLARSQPRPAPLETGVSPSNASSPETPLDAAASATASARPQTVVTPPAEAAPQPVRPDRAASQGPAPTPTRGARPATPLPSPGNSTPSADSASTRADAPVKTAAELRAEVDAVLASYARAIETENVAGLRSIYPAMAPEQIDGFRTFFDAARDIRITIGRVEAPAQLQASPGSEARVRVEYRIEYFNTSLRRAARETATWQAVLERTDTGWRVRSIR
jgi:serine/threonine-protein kinase